jgi:hypothetical protein
MTYCFKNVLDDHNVDNILFDSGTDGHMGIIFKPYTDENQKILDDIHEYLGQGNRKKLLRTRLAGTDLSLQQLIGSLSLCSVGIGGLVKLVFRYPRY